MRRNFVLGLGLAVALGTVACNDDQPLGPSASPALSAKKTATSPAPSKYSIPVGRFKISRTHLRNPNVRVSDVGIGTDAVGHVIDPTDYVCDPSTPILDWLDGEIAKLDPDLLDLIFGLAGDVVPLYEPWLFESPGKEQYFGYTGEFTKTVRKTDKDVKRFWNIFSGDIRLLGAHGTILLDVEKVAATYEALFVDDDGNPIPHEDALLFASFLRDALLNEPALNGGNHPLLSFNAVAFSGAGTPSDAIVMGDGILEGFKVVGLDDVAPQAIYAHEFGHQIQSENDYFDDDVPGATTQAELTMYTELMADAFAGYYLTHKRGAGLKRQRVEDFLQIFFQLGDCAFTNPGHHGTPNQRMKAARFGFAVADEAQKKGHILTSQQFHALFVAAYPGIIAPDAT